MADLCVVIGGGLAGMTAAIRFAEQGGRSIVLERSDAEGGDGNARISGGLFHIAWRPMDEPADALFDAVIATTDGEADPSLARTLADNALEATTWLEKQGAEFARKGPRPYMKFALAPHTVGVGKRHIAERGPDQTMCRLYERARDLGVEIRTGASASRLAPAPSGWEVTYHTVEGVETVTTETVMVADGGFQGNQELLARYVGANAGSAFLRASDASTGNGLSMLLDAGAGATGLGRVYGHVVSRNAFDNDELWPYPPLDKLCLMGALVDRGGRLFPTAAENGVQLVNELVRAEDPRGFYVICDDALWQDAGTDNPYGTPVPNPDLQQRGGHFVSAHTLEDLAAELGMPVEVLRSSVASHNTATGKAGLSGAPFHALAVVPGITFTQGGVRTDDSGRVLDTAGHPIPGLFAAGSCVGGIQGGPRGGYVGGLAVALVFGYVAGVAMAANKTA